MRIRGLILWMLAGAGACPGDWNTLGGDARRSSGAPVGPVDLSAPTWCFEPAADESIVPAATPIACAGRVYVIARVFADGLHMANRVIAVSAVDGVRLWSADLEPDLLDSWSTPAFDAANDRLMVASGYTLSALNAADGAISWQTVFSNPLINVSPVVSVGFLEADVPANRVYVTDYAPYGTGTLFAINVEDNRGPSAPYDPGDVVWSAALGPTAGNSASLSDSSVVVTTVDGQIKAFEAQSGLPRWTTQALAVSPSHGFFGGCALDHGYVYAASYRFDGGSNNSQLVKLSGADGSLVWSVACERTDSIPVVHRGRVYLAGGINGFGSAPRVQAFDDGGLTASLVWDTYADTAGSLLLGHWVHQPARLGRFLVVGMPDALDALDYGLQVHRIDTELTPADPEFVVDGFVGAGGAAAADAGAWYVVGSAGLFRFDGELSPGDSMKRIPVGALDEVPVE